MNAAIRLVASVAIVAGMYAIAVAGIHDAWHWMAADTAMVAVSLCVLSVTRRSS